MRKNFKILSAMLLAVVLAVTLIAPVGALTFNSGSLTLLLRKSFYYYDGEVLVARQDIVRGEVNEALALEEKDGMILEGWYTDKELTEKYDFTQPVDSGAKLYAKWVEASEAVTPEEPEVVEPEVETDVTEEPTEEIVETPEETEETTEE